MSAEVPTATRHSYLVRPRVLCLCFSQDRRRAASRLRCGSCFPKAGPEPWSRLRPARSARHAVAAQSCPERPRRGAGLRPCSLGPVTDPGAPPEPGVQGSCREVRQGIQKAAPGRLRATCAAHRFHHRGMHSSNERYFQIYDALKNVLFCYIFLTQ